MPKGVKKGDRRGKYNKSRAGSVAGTLGPAFAVVEAMHDHIAPPDPWTDADRELFAALVADSPLTSVATKQAAARRAVEAHRQCMALDAMARSADDDANLCKASTQFRKQIELLQVAVKVKDDEDEL